MLKCYSQSNYLHHLIQRLILSCKIAPVDYLIRSNYMLVALSRNFCFVNEKISLFLKKLTAYKKVFETSRYKINYHQLEEFFVLLMRRSYTITINIRELKNLNFFFN